MLTKVSYADTELKAEPSGPKVTEEEYQEYVVLTELALDSVELHGWSLLRVPAETERLESIIDALTEAKNALE